MRSAIRSSNRQSWPTRRTSASRGTGLAEAKMAASTRSIHSRQRAAARQVGELDVEALRLSRWRRRAAALTGRTAGTWAGPRARATAPSATSRSNSRRAARSVIGAWRAASAGETQSSASSRSTILAAGLARSLGATAIRVSERRERSAARSRAEAAASAIAPAAAFGQAGLAGPRPSPGPVRSQSRVENFRRDQRQGPRPAQPDGDDHVERPRGR